MKRDKILNDESTQGHSDTAWQGKHRDQGPSEAPRGGSGCLWHISCASHARKTQWETCLPCDPRNKLTGIFSSTFQTLTGIQISGILLKYRLWFRRSGVGPERLHFTQAPRWCQSCWSIDHQDLKSCENMGLTQYAMRRNEAMCVKNFRFPGRNLLFN